MSPGSCCGRFAGAPNAWPRPAPFPAALAVGSRLYLNEFLYLWGDFAAAAILSGLPITIVFLLAQRYLVSGLADGGVKG